MDEKLTSPLNTLPVELHYRILDHLDFETILFSFGHVCQRFRAIVNAYNQYEIDLSSISKSNFHAMCRLIRPENVISLTLSDGDKTPGQIGLFLSLFRIHQFTRLRHLTLIRIDNEAQKKISRQISSCPLVLLSIDARGKSIKSTAAIISSVIQQGTLFTINLNSSGPILDKVSWPTYCSLLHLKIQKCKQKQFVAILNQLPRLRTFEMDDYTMSSTDTIIATIYPSLISLTMNNSTISMVAVESLLSLTPSLMHLKLISKNSYHFQSISNGSRWEEVIQSKLPELETFEFFFAQKYRRRNLPLDIESVIEPFRRPFWLKYKR
ncbi:unnamed protein product, partial [Didymodactylos carnosus]